MYDAESLHRDLVTLWNSGRFDNIELTREPGQTGWIITFVVTERPVVRTIKYDGLKSITTSEVLDRFKERRVGLTPESTYDRNKVQRAQVVLEDYLAERGRQFATVTPELQPFPPSSLNIVFKVDEGPKVKVGKIDIEGNTVFSDLHRAAGHAESAPHRHPVFQRWRKTFSPEPTTPPSWTRTRGGSSSSTNPRDISRPASRASR